MTSFPGTPTRFASRSVHGVVSLAEERVRRGFSVRSLRPQLLPLDPFLSLDEFHMSEPTFPPHPHAGFSAVTYMFESSAGAFTNRDSLGDRSVIAPGALHWTQAARGMMHEEVPSVPGVDCHGMQMFVNLRRADKLAAPRAFHVDANAVPQIEDGNVRVRVLAGSIGDVCSPLELLTDALLFDVHLAARASLELPIARGSTAFALAIDGAGSIDAHGTRLGAHEAAAFSGDGDGLTLRAGDNGMHLLVGGGAPLGEPVVFGGPFAMSTREELNDAFERFHRGEMGALAPSF
jgi:redox-sensitive bicupin YhaK (pirin superfamily)